jgi:hypothetical protein
MKSLIALAAAAALAGGISLANAQNSGNTPAENTSPSSINAGAQKGNANTKSGSESAGTAMKSNRMKSAKAKITGKGKFCLSTAPSGNVWSCKFASMEACQKAAKTGLEQKCQPNPNMASTTGMKQ